ncbi:MAG: hypothetical protein JXO51_05540 [Candidatus Aminicenantes bacterium]|nr:hypothetical protein [Candidatus Aminicenantes bacterium]
MENQDKAWREIQLLIERDKAAALEEFHHRPLPLAETPLPRQDPWLRFRPAALAAASLLLAAGLVSFWLLRGNWNSAPRVPAASELLADSLLYGRSGSSGAESGAGTSLSTAAPLFTAWAEAALRQSVSAAPDPIDPSAPVERGDPDEVRRRIGRAIHEGAFERWLCNLKEFTNEEA